MPSKHSLLSRTPQRRGVAVAQSLKRRSAFTLLELLIAIAIIAVLAGLILTAGAAAMKRSRDAQVSVDIQDLVKSIALFKNRFGMEPPSSIKLYETSSGWTGDARAMGIIRQLWPQFDFTISQDINNNGTGGETITLTGAECLVFFLGGTPDSAANKRAPLGFSQNPANPFAIGGTNRERFHEFQVNRYLDIDSDGMPEICDPLPAQERPYLYLSSYSGRGYDMSDLVGSPANATNAPGGTFIDVYRQGSQGYWAATSSSQPESTATVGTTNTSTPSQPWNPNSFQIISPGGDHQYGVGGEFAADTAGTLLNVYPGSPAVDRSVERDNITNFHSGILAP